MVSDKFSIQYSKRLAIPLLRRKPARDQRGMFEKLYEQNINSLFDLSFEITQINLSSTKVMGARRGLHFQLPPFGDPKIVTCISGQVFDVVVDIRRDSPTFLCWESFYLDGNDGVSLCIPIGFAHGFQALTGGDVLLYCHGGSYEPNHESGLLLDDPMLKIDWPLKSTLESDRDASFVAMTPDFKGFSFEV